MAPDENEPGELVMLHNHFVWVLGLLRRVRNVKVHFVESATRRWTSEEGTLTSSVADREPAWIERNNARPCLQLQFDLELLLFTVRCHSKHRCKVTLPTRILTSTSALRAYTNVQQCPAKDTHSELRHAQDWGLYLDLLLDALPGLVAKKLRVIRTATWSDEYFWSTWTRACVRKPLENPVFATKDKKAPPEGIPQSLAVHKLFLWEEADRLKKEMACLREKTVITSPWVGALVMLYIRLEHVQERNPSMSLRLFNMNLSNSVPIEIYGIKMSPDPSGSGHGWDWQSYDLARTDEWDKC